MDNYEITFKTWDKLANQYQDKFMDLDLYNDSYDVFCKLIEKKSPAVFEIGCGPGNITKYILEKRPDFIIDAIDVAPNMIELAKKNNASASFKVMDCRGIHQIKKKFDAIICGFCMPYLSKEDCEKLISDSSVLLNKNGIFYFSVIEDDYNKSTHETSSDGQHNMYVYYHQENYLHQYLTKSKFELIQVMRINYDKSDGSKQVHLIFIAKKI